MQVRIYLPGDIVRRDVDGTEFLRIGTSDALEIGVEDLLEAGPQQQRDAVKEGVQHGDASALHHQSK